MEYFAVFKMLQPVCVHINPPWLPSLTGKASLQQGHEAPAGSGPLCPFWAYLAPEAPTTMDPTGHDPSLVALDSV